MNNKTTLAIAALVAGALLTTAATVLPSAEAIGLDIDVQTNYQDDNNFNNQQILAKFNCGIAAASGGSGGSSPGQCASNNDDSEGEED